MEGQDSKTQGKMIFNSNIIFLSNIFCSLTSVASKTYTGGTLETLPDRLHNILPISYPNHYISRHFGSKTLRNCSLY